MNIKQIVTVVLCLLLCLSSAGCGKDKQSDPAKLQTPQYSVDEPAEIEISPEEEIHTAEKGIKIINPILIIDESVPNEVLPAVDTSLTPETAWDDDAIITWNAFTLPEKAAFDDGSIGILSVPQIGLTVKVYESDDQMEDMDKGAAHFKSTSAWDGNVALSGHNRTVSGTGAYFRDLHKLSVGDTLLYKTALGEREYRVTTVKTISDEDWSSLSRTTDNRLTLITCVNDNAAKRLLVQAVQR